MTYKAKLLKKPSLKVFRRDLFIVAVFFALIIGLIWTPMDSFKLTSQEMVANTSIGTEGAGSFSRQMGEALSYGIDVGKRVQNMTFYAFFYFPIITVICWALLGLLFRETEITEEGQKFLNRIISVILPGIIATTVLRLNQPLENVFMPAAVVYVPVVLVYLRFLKNRMTLSSFKWSLFTSIPLSFVLIRLVSQTAITVTGNPDLRNAACAGIFLVSIMISVLYGGFAQNHNGNTLFAAATSVYLAPILLSTFLEIFNILNQHGVFIRHKGLVCIAVSGCCILGGLIWYAAGGKKKIIDSDKLQRVQFFLLIVGLLMLVLQPPTQIAATREYFETSNDGSDVYSFLAFGEIPLVENLNVHLILDEVGAILYGILNADVTGAAWYAYPITTFISWLTLYYFIRMLTDREYAVLFMIFFPVRLVTYILPMGSAICFLPILVAIPIVKKKNRLTCFLYVLACVMTCLYRADIGIAISAGSLIILTIYLAFRKEGKTLATLWIIGAITGAICLGLFLLLCVIRGISPMARLLEFISVMGNSDPNWAFRLISTTYTDIRYYLCYLICPIVSVLCSGLVLVKRKEKEIPDYLVITIVVLTLAQCLEFGRGIVRHNLFENWIQFQLGYSVMAIAIAIWALIGRKANRLSICLGAFVVIQIIATGSTGANSYLLQEGYNRQTASELNASYEEKIDRIVIPDYGTTIKTIFDRTLTADQSFLDYSTDTMLYTLTERNKPVYINQSPSQLNREFDHLLFLHEIGEIDCPYAICTIYDKSFDGISIDMNHYLVAEYLYEKYTPLCTADEYCLWVRKEEYAERRAMIEKMIDEGTIVSSFVESDADELQRTYSMGMIPYLWGTFEKAEQQETAETLDQYAPIEGEAYYPIHTDQIDRSEGNYLEIITEAENDGRADIRLLSPEGKMLCDVSFDLVRGRNRYLIRISGNYMWHTDLVDRLILATDVNIADTEVNVLKGDIAQDSMNGLQRNVLNGDLKLNAAPGRK